MGLQFHLSFALICFAKIILFFALINCSSFRIISPGVSSDDEIKNPFIEDEKQSLILRNRCQLYRIVSEKQLDLILQDPKNQMDSVRVMRFNRDFSKHIFFLVVESENPYTKNLFELEEVYLNHFAGKILVFYNYDDSQENGKNKKNETLPVGKSMQYEYFNLTPKQPAFEKNRRKTRRYIVQFDENKMLDRLNYLDLKLAKDKIRFPF
ncbi:hypothetical protein [Leptospira ilyithenensis]|uniref:Uncharacterized protein n=1 Tax=Leptospira ilyithenensis TaxID=2484901 RepID=A0A4R9LSW1_9LEPT|nr:hypothetical protein [Leptospira ilyithenensis]TGN13170.1 hypothetical protein EHS11_04550 [Leptospira ilyithenensis]